MGGGLSCAREPAISVIQSKVKQRLEVASASGTGSTPSKEPGPYGARPASAPAAGGPSGSLTTASPAAPPDGRTSSDRLTADGAPVHPRRLPHIGGLAVSLAFLVDFAERHVGRSQPTWSVVEQLVKPHTLQDTIRYVDLSHMAPNLLPAGRSDYYFISHAWGRPFWEMVGLCAHYLRGAVASDTYVWCDIFIINQHPGQQQADDLNQLRLAVKDAEATLVCTDAAGAPFERIWCLYEMWTTLTVSASSSAAGGKAGKDEPKELDAKPGSEDAECSRKGEALAAGGSSEGGRVRSRSQALVVLTTGLSAAQRAKLYSQIDAASARATVAADKERILADIAVSPGGLASFNAGMRCALLLRPLDYEGEVAAAATAAATEWDFSPLDAWLELPPGHPQYRALALLGPPGTGKSTAAAAAISHMAAAPTATKSAAKTRVAGEDKMSVAAACSSSRTNPGACPGECRRGGIPTAAHFCRANALQALDPLAALRTLAYQLSLIYPDQLQHYYAFKLAKEAAQERVRSAEGEVAFALRAIVGMASAEGGSGGSGAGGAGSGGSAATDPVAAAFDVLLLRPLNLVWKAYEDAVKSGRAEGSVNGAAEQSEQADQGAAGKEAGASAAVGGQDGGKEASTALLAATREAPRLVILLDAVDEGDAAGSGAGHENGMLLMLQEHFPRLPAFVRLIVTARSEPHIRALLAHTFAPRFVSPADMRAPEAACAAALATRLAARPALSAVAAAAQAAGRGGADDPLTSLAKHLWKVSKGWMLFLRLAQDILESAAAATASTTGTTSKRAGAAASLGGSISNNLPGRPASATSASVPQPLATVMRDLQEAAASASAAVLYQLYVRKVLAPGLRAGAPGGGSVDAAQQLGADGPGGRAAQQLVFLLEVLGAAREPLFLSQLQDLGLPAIASHSDDPAATPTEAAGGFGARGDYRADQGPGQGRRQLQLGSLVRVRGYKLHGVHRSLFEWLSAGGADILPGLLGSADGAATAGAAMTPDDAASDAAATAAVATHATMGIRRGHASLASMALRDIAAARASQAGGGGARGPRAPDPYSLQHGVAHVLAAAADQAAAGEEAATSLLGSLLLDFYFWRCVYQDGAAASVALGSLLRHADAFAGATAAGIIGAASQPPPTVRAAALAADVARWLQSYHGSLLQHPEAVLQSALALPTISLVRRAALAALTPQPAPEPARSRPNSGSGTVPRLGSPPANQAGACTGTSRPTSARVRASDDGVVANKVTNAAAAPSAACALASSAGSKLSAQLGGTQWPSIFQLANPPAAWDACLLTMESRGTTRGLAWLAEQGLVVTACDDKKVHLISPVTGAQVALMSGHSDRVYCVALRPSPLGLPGRSSTGGSTAGQRSSPVAAPHAPPAAPSAPLLASGSLDGSVALWDGSTRVQLQLLQPGETQVPRPPDGDGDAGDGAGVTTFGYSVVEDRPTGPSASGSVDCVAFSADGAWLAAGTSKGSVTVWQVLDTGDQGTQGGGGEGVSTGVRAVKAWVCPSAHTEGVAGLAFIQLPCGPGAAALPPLVLASCSEDGAIHLWDPRAGSGDSTTHQRSLADGSPAPQAYIASQPLRTLRSNSDAQLQYEATGQLPQPHLQYETAGTPDPWFIQELKGCGCRKGVEAEAGAREGPTASSAATPVPVLSGVAEDADGPQSRASYRAPQHLCLAAGPGLPSGCLLAGSGSGPVAVWDVAAGVLRERLRSHVGAVHCLALQDGAPNFASGSADCTVRLWRHVPTAEPESWSDALKEARKQAEHDAQEAAAAAAAAMQARDEARRAGQGTEEGLEAADVPPPKRTCRRPCQWRCVAVLHGHNRLVTSAVFLDPLSGFDRHLASGQRRGGSLAPGETRLVTSSVDFTVRFWSVDQFFARNGCRGSIAAGNSDALASRAGPGGAGATHEVPGHTGYLVNAVAVSGNGRLIATAADDFTACVWDAATGAHLRTLHGHHGRVSAVAFSRDSVHLATAAGDGDVRVFSCEDFSTTGWCRGHTKAATGVAFSPDGYNLASSSEDGTARIWSIRGHQTSVLQGHPSGATAIAWAEEGYMVATGAARGDPGVQVWDARMGMHINTFRYHVTDVMRLAFGSATEPTAPPPPPAAAKAPGSRPASGTSCAPAPEVAAPAAATPPRRHVLLLSVDLRGLACIWDVWGGGLLHSVEHVQGADLTGSRLLWLQARAMHYADLQELWLPTLEAPEDSGANGGDGEDVGQQRRRRRQPATAFGALYPASEAVDVVAVGPEMSCVTAVTDRQRLYIFRPKSAGCNGIVNGSSVH